MALYVLNHNKNIYDSLTEVRMQAVRYLNRTNREVEHIDIIRNIMGDEVKVPLGHVVVKKDKKGKKRYLWISGHNSNWRVLDSSGHVVRKPTKEDRKLWRL